MSRLERAILSTATRHSFWIGIFGSVQVFGGLAASTFAWPTVFPPSARIACIVGFLGAMMGLINQRSIRARRISPETGMAMALGVNSLWHGSTLALADQAADGTASAAMLALFVVQVCAPAYQMRVTWDAPVYFAAPALAALLAGTFGERSPVIYAATASVAIGTGAILGDFGLRTDARQADELRLQEAHAGRLLDLRERENTRLRAFLERLAGHTHDLGGPALALSATLARLQTAASDTVAVTGLVHRAQRDADVLMAMIRDAKNEVRHAALPPLQAAEVAAAVAAVVGRIGARFPDSHLAVVGGGASWVEIRGGANALTRIVENLAANACAAARTSRIKWRLDGGSIALEVDDDGPGLDLAFAPQTGRGLASVRHVVETSGGAWRIERSSALGGARIVVLFPAVESPAHQQTSGSTSPQCPVNGQEPPPSQRIRQ